MSNIFWTETDAGGMKRYDRDLAKIYSAFSESKTFLTSSKVCNAGISENSNVGHT